MSTVEIPKLEYAFSVRIEFKERLRFEPTTPMEVVSTCRSPAALSADRGCKAG